MTNVTLRLACKRCCGLHLGLLGHLLWGKPAAMWWGHSSWKQIFQSQICLQTPEIWLTTQLQPCKSPGATHLSCSQILDSQKPRDQKRSWVKMWNFWVICYASMKGGIAFSLDCMSLPQTYRVWFSGEGPRNLHECLWVILWPSIVWEPLLFFSLTALFLSSLPPFLLPPTVPFPKALSRAFFLFTVRSLG